MNFWIKTTLLLVQMLFSRNSSASWNGRRALARMGVSSWVAWEYSDIFFRMLLMTSRPSVRKLSCRSKRPPSFGTNESVLVKMWSQFENSHHSWWDPTFNEHFYLFSGLQGNVIAWGRGQFQHPLCKLTLVFLCAFICMLHCQRPTLMNPPC
jgi:hypothetical protein